MRLSEVQARHICEKRGTLRVLLDARQKHMDTLDCTIRAIEECDASIQDEIQELFEFLLEDEDEDDTHGA